jgi:hypothetical protein
MCLRQMHNDPDWLILWQLSRPTDNELLGIFVEISFSERKWIERVKELGDVVDSYLDRM